MRKTLALLFFLALPLAAEERPRATLADMKWLTGHWSGTGLGGFVEEIWSDPRGGAMMGMFRLVRGDEPVFYELLHVVESGGSLAIRLEHFNRDLTGWEEKNEVREFELLAVRDGAWHFEGMVFLPIEGRAEGGAHAPSEGRLDPGGGLHVPTQLTERRRPRAETKRPCFKTCLL